MQTWVRKRETGGRTLPHTGRPMPPRDPPGADAKRVPHREPCRRRIPAKAANAAPRITRLDGSGTGVSDPSSPSRSPLMPLAKKRVFGFPFIATCSEV